MMTDQHRADYLGCYGHPILRTPHIDELAERGTRFDNFHVASPVCMPNRAALLTGRYPSVNGVRYNGNILSYRASTFVDVLRKGGYRTAHIGKSHVQPMTAQAAYQRAVPASLGVIDEAWRDDGEDYGHEQAARYTGTERYRIRTPYYGFDQVDMVTLHGVQCHGHYYQWLKQHTADADWFRDPDNQLPHDYVCPQAVRTPLPEELYPTSYIRDRAIDFLNEVRGDEQPFIAFVSFPDPHHPFTPPGRYWSMYDPADFEVRLPYEAHRNPPPPLRYAREQLEANTRRTDAQGAFMGYEHELREAMALSCGMITMIDDAVGGIIEALKMSGRYADTVIIFNSDHGDYLGDYGLLLKGALPFRSITRVPFIWCDPDDRGARTTGALACTLDIAPTIIERAGLKPYWGIQGRSLLGERVRSEGVREALMIEYEDGQKRMGFSEPAILRSLITDRYRLTLYRGEAWGELYDLRVDPDESHNLWDDPLHAEVRAGLIENLAHSLMEAVDTSPRSTLIA